MTHLPNLSLYIHIPWCIKKCPYCDFNSHTFNNELPEKNYIEALLHDLDNELDHIQNRTLKSIFFGGGTPSLFSANSYHQLLESINKKIPFSKSIEITMEANPGTYEHDRFKCYLDVGINRLSLGVQSFKNEQLKALGRIHSAQEAYQAIQSLKKIGWKNFNIDLMHGLPQQTPKAALFDLETAINLKPTHISWYQLTIEPNTIFYSKTPSLPKEDTLWKIQETGIDFLTKSGFEQYEISAYCLPNYQSQHNLNYWNFGDYIGIGAGAHGKWTSKQSNNIYRNWKTRSPTDYLNTNKSYEAGKKQLTQKDLIIEFMMNALRLKNGVPTSVFIENTGLALITVQNMRQKAIDKGLLVEDANRLKATKKGFLFLNDLLEIFT